MAIFTVGFKSGGYAELGLDTNVEPGSVAIYNADSTSGTLAQVYGHLRTAATAGARPILLGTNKDTDEFKVLSALMVAYDKYDIYLIEPEQLTSENYLEELVAREPTAIEAEEYIDNGLASYNDLVKLLLRLKGAVMSGNQDEVSQLITDNQAAIAGAASLVDSLKHWANKTNSGSAAELGKGLAEAEQKAIRLQSDLDKALADAKSTGEKLANLESELSSARQDLEKLENTKLALEEEKSRLSEEKAKLESELQARAKQSENSKPGYTEEELQRKLAEVTASVKKDYESRVGLITGELKQSKERITALEGQINNSGPVIKTYTEIKTSLIQCKARSVVYFKEISAVRYSPTLIVRFMEILTRMKRLKVKLVIYDNQHGFVSTYKPLPVIGFQEYLGKRENIVEQVDKLVVVEPNPAIMEDILKADYDVVIVVDRLKQANDIVSGNNVYKYWIINSNNDAMAIQSQFKVDFRSVISRPGVFDGALGILEDPDYRDRTTSSKLQAYVSMKLPDGRGLMDEIMSRTSISTIAARQRR